MGATRTLVYVITAVRVGVDLKACPTATIVAPGVIGAGLLATCVAYSALINVVTGESITRVAGVTRARVTTHAVGAGGIVGALICAESALVVVVARAPIGVECVALITGTLI